MFKQFKVLLVALVLVLSTGVEAKGSHSSGRSGGFSSGKSSGSKSSGGFSSGSKSGSSGSKSSGGSFSSGSKSSGSSSSSGKAVTPPSKSKSGSSYDKSASVAKSKQESAQKYTAYRNKQADQNLKSLPQSTVDTRGTRSQQTFSTYYSRPIVVYHDPFNAFFWLWLLDHPSYQAQWAYNHRSSMSDERYEELKKKNADLEKQMNELKQKGTAQDPTYTPPGVDSDLMYSDDYVTSVKDEDKVAPTVSQSTDADADDDSGVVWMVVLGLVLALGLIFIFVIAKGK